ncbi:hypothetical protein [Alicyclobacillus herbarius]|uniref:hypothetical protein n=1 Tax=Alicyclobacillus herbarius TaxID=122960 RepID=UPI0012DF36A4|nr:hypothetical protein [Alicyclobacillus herbarius]
MRRRKGDSTPRNKTVVTGILRAIDLWIAFLLLTGQITTTGVYLSSGAIWLSLSGPIIGGPRQEGTTAGSGFALDAIDVLTALLLIVGQITNTGPWISSGRFSLVVSGPAFGNPDIPVAASPDETSPRAQEFFTDFCQLVVRRQVRNR